MGNLLHMYLWILFFGQELLTPLVTDTDISMEISGFAALALGLVFTSTCKEVRGRDHRKGLRPERV